jgi:hypothetical protein
MSAIEVKIKGLEKLTKLAEKYPKVSQKHIDQAIVRSIGEIDIATKPLTPVKTARLRNSMVPIFRPFKGVYGSALDYASSVHDLYKPGTPYKNPSLNKRAVAGFLAVGVKRSMDKINKEMASALERIVAELAR